MPIKYRADQVGSFLRPPEIKDAHTAHAEGKLSLEELRKVEDNAILGLLEMQKQSGIDVYSDGEWRRGGWSGGFAEAMEQGFVEGTPAVVLTGQSNPRDTAGIGRQQGVPGQGGGRRVLGAPLVQKRRITEHESKFLKEHAPGPFKITMPAASYVVSRAYNPEISDKVFGSRAGLLKAVAEVIREEVEALVAEGVPYIQLDNPHYTDFVSEDIVAKYQELGMDPDQVLEEDVEADNYSISGVDRSNVVFGMHYCRGNTPGGGWHKAGGYDRVAEITFGKLAVDNFLLEYDTERAGTFEPLRFMPKRKTVVLGLITTKFPELESEDDVIRRIEEASKFVDMDDLTLSPQCGFASTFQGNLLTEDDQRKKLELVARVARRVWG
jgi:5-methyltetrahydropteroyltriglutamate--homocysteine methyltransferase